MYRKTPLGNAGVAAWAYRTAPRFCKQYSQERRRQVLAAPERPDPSRWSDCGIHAAWLGHSTVLLKIDGVTFLTAPVFSTRAGLNLGLFTVGIKRFVAPALAMSELPKIDIVLLSHAHFDHFDIPSLRALEARGTAVVTAAHTADLLRVMRRVRKRGIRTLVGMHPESVGRGRG